MNSPAQAPAATETVPASHKVLVAVLALAFFIVPYLTNFGGSGSLGAELVGDGLELVTRNQALLDVQNDPSLGTLGATLTATWWEGSASAPVLYRPVPTFLLGLTAMAAGPYNPAEPGDAPFPYHAIILGLYVITALLVTELAFQLTRNAKAALVSGALFATLPVHLSAVLDVGNIAVLSAAALGFGAWLLWLRSADKPSNLPGAAILLLLACLSHESALALPVIFFFGEFARAREGGIGSGMATAMGRSGALILCLVSVAAALVLRASVGGQLLPQFQPTQELTNPLLSYDVLTRAANGLRMMAAGTGAALGINTLSSNWGFGADYSFGQVPVLKAFSLWNLFGLAVVLFSVFLAVRFYKSCRTRSALVLGFFAFLLLISNVILPTSHMFSEAPLFLPSALVAIFLGATLVRFGSAGAALGLALAAGAGVWNHVESRNWVTNTDYWEHNIRNTSVNSARAHYAHALDAISAEIPYLAKTNLERAVEIYPAYAEAYALLGNLYLMPGGINDAQLAVKCFRSSLEIQLEQTDYSPPAEPLITQFDFGPRALLFRLNALSLFNKESANAKEHLSYLDGLIAKGYNSAYIHHRRATALIANGQPDEAEAAFKKSYEMEPTKDCIEAYGRFLRDRGKYEDALTLYAQVTDFSNQYEKARILLARAETEALVQSEGPEKVLSTINELLTLNQSMRAEGEEQLEPVDYFRLKYIEARAKLALYENELNRERLEEVAFDLKAAVANSTPTPESIEASGLLAQILLSLGELDDAREIYEELVRVSQQPSLGLMLGDVYYKLGRYPDALDQFQRVDSALVDAVEMYPDDVQFQAVLASTRSKVLNIYSKMEKEQDALVTIEQWHQEAPNGNDPNVLMIHAGWLAGLGDMQGALQQANMLEAEFPGLPSAQSFLSNIKNMAELESKLLQAELPAGDLELLASLRNNFGNHEGAIELARRAIAAHETIEEKVRSTRLLSICLVAAEKAGEAVEELSNLLEMELPADQRANIELELGRLKSAIAQ